MISLLFIVAAAAVMADLVLGQDAYICDYPSTGCRFGMFNQEKCACECILPFCPDASGQCTATGGCANPWEDCERGVNCPWWINSANAQSCTTGPLVRNTSVSVVWGAPLSLPLPKHATNIIFIVRFLQDFGKSLTRKRPAAKLASLTLKLAMSSKEPSRLPNIPPLLLRRMNMKSFPSELMSWACQGTLLWES